MSAAKRHAILSYLDSPLKILFWTKGEILMVLGPFFVSVVLDTFLLGVTACLINVYLIKTYKKHFGEGQLMAVLYWYFPSMDKLKGLPRSCVREYLG
jgi:type IV conjugative transfer system protein TraL